MGKRANTAAIAAVTAASAVFGGFGGGSASADDGLIAAYQLNENRGTILHDSSGNGYNGTIGKRVGLRGSFHHFGKTPPRTVQPQRIDRVAENQHLDPLNHRYVVKVKFRWDNKDHDNNLVQKGQGSGNIFKMKTSVPSQPGQPRGGIKCLFWGDRGASQTESWHKHKKLNDGKWHTVTCSRTAKGTSMVIDGKKVDKNKKDPGKIDNNYPLAIGGNTVCDPANNLICNYWQGDIGFVKIYGKK